MLLVLGCAAAPAFAARASIGIATWNLHWLMDAATHARWTEACARHGWPRDTALLPAAARAELAQLPYCNVHNGMRFPPDSCKSQADDWPQAARYPATHPCRDTADLAAWPHYERKLIAQRAIFKELALGGVQVVAVQEVSSAAAVAAVVPPGWKVATTHEFPESPRIAQHVGVAWAPGVTLTAIAALPQLADGGIAERPLRPGLAFTLGVAGKPVRILVVHLKAGCRSRAIDAPLTARDARLDPDRQDQIATDCAMLRYQVPALEAWIDRHTGADFALLGDFNRTLLREPVQDTATFSSRLDASPTSSPVGPCTMRREGQRFVAQCPARIASLFPEINDGAPRGSVVWRARIAREHAAASSGCRITGPRGNLAHEGIDHILISASLKRRLAADALSMRVVNFAGAHGAALRATPELALPSDHCPHVVTWSPLLP